MGLPILAAGSFGTGLFAGTENGSTAQKTCVMQGVANVSLNDVICLNSLVSAGHSAALRLEMLLPGPSQGPAGGSHGGGGLLETG